MPKMYQIPTLKTQVVLNNMSTSKARHAGANEDFINVVGADLTGNIRSADGADTMRFGSKNEDPQKLSFFSGANVPAMNLSSGEKNNS